MLKSILGGGAGCWVVVRELSEKRLQGESAAAE